MINCNVGGVEDVICRVNEGVVVSGVMNRTWKGYKKEMYEIILLPTVLYVAETWGFGYEGKYNTGCDGYKALRQLQIRKKNT